MQSEQTMTLEGTTAHNIGTGQAPLVLTLEQCARAMNGSLLAGDPRLKISSYSIDTRTIAGGDLFFAIVGPNHDAHRFLDRASAAGASALVISASADDLPDGRLPEEVAAIRVPDTTEALQRLASSVRDRIDGLTVVGITGSCGKTTAKEISRRLLATAAPTLHSEGNLNNLYGLPLTLLRLGPEHRRAVCEMGISYPGEMERLVAIARPEVGMMLNVTSVHLENFESVDQIAAEKGRLITSLPSEGAAVINADDPRVAAMTVPPGCRVFDFGIDNPARVMARDVELMGLEGVRFSLVLTAEQRVIPMNSPLTGRHNLSNLLAALSLACALGIDPESLVETVGGLRPYSMRGVVLKLSRRITILDDSYNANPRAMGAVLELAAGIGAEGRKIAVLGDMLELGEGADRAHRVIGRLVAENGFDLLVAVGGFAGQVVEGSREGGMPAEALFTFETAETAGEHLTNLLDEGDFLLVKGSRGVHLERLVERIRKDFPPEGSR